MNRKWIWLAGLALLASLAITGTVFAEGEEPPATPEEPAEIGSPVPAEEPAAVDELPAGPVEEAPVEQPAVEEEAASVEPVETIPVEETPAEAGEFSETTEVAEPILVNAEGDPLVLASEESAEIMENADPYFTSEGTKYCFVPLAGSCDGSCDVCIKDASPIQASIDYININGTVPTDGCIYVEKATYVGNVSIDGDLTYLNSLSGLTGLPDAFNIFPTIGGSLTITNMDFGFSLLGFNVPGGVNFLDNDGPISVESVTGKLMIANCSIDTAPSHGIHVKDHKGNITVTDSSSVNNGGHGVFIENQISGNVIAKNMTVNANFGDGINISSVGTVTMSNISAYENLDNGISIYTPTKSVSINGAVTNSNNTYAGIYIASRGATLRNIVSNMNAAEGILLDMYGGSALLENIAAIQNGEEGIQISSEHGGTSSVILKNSVANYNQNGGVYIDVQGSVTVANVGTHGNTYGNGLFIYTNGAVSGTNLSSSNNEGNGFYVRTKASITLANIFANSNDYSGADLDNCLYDDGTSLCLGTGGITITNASGVMNDLNSNQRYGLWAVSKGSIVVINLRANDNDSDGALLTNRFGGSTAPITVKTLGYVRNAFSGNGKYEEFHPDPGDYYMVLANGLSALSAGNISVSNTDAYGNYSNGGGIYLDAKFTTSPRTVTLTNSTTGENDWVGVWIFSRGNIVLTDVSAYNNYQGGIHLDNCMDHLNGEDNICTGIGSIRLTRIEANDNMAIGLEAISRGIITLNTATAHNNLSIGIKLNNAFVGTTAGVTAANIYATDNQENGLVINTLGSATLTNLHTNNNAMRHGGIGNGQTVQDFFNGSLGPDSWRFDAEYDVNYTFVLRADVAWGLNRVSFDPWIELYDPDTKTQIPIPVNCYTDDYCTFDFLPFDYGYLSTHSFYVMVGSNSNDGFYRLSLNDPDPDDSTVMFWIGGTNITAGGNIKVTSIESHSNSLIGLGAVTITNGSITLSNLGISDNGTEGVYLICGQDPNDFNNAGFGTGTIAISGSNYVGSNGWEGLIIRSSGAINFKNLDVKGNGHATNSDGIRVYEDHALKSATLYNVNSSANGGRGIWLISTGSISLAKVNVWSNYGDTGIYLDNCLDDGYGNCSGTGSIMLASVNANDNHGSGLVAYSKGTISAKTINANGNWDWGATFNNQFTGSVSGITLSYVTANNNGNTGISVYTNGSLIMSNLNANSNANVWNSLGNGETAQDFFNQSKGPDHWFFEAQEGVPYTLLLQADGYGFPGLLNRYSFDPYMELYTADGVQITSGLSILYDTNNFYEITWTPGSGEGGLFYLQVSSTSFDGFYRVSVNDSTPEYPDRYYFVNGLGYNVGGNVTLTGTNILNDNSGAGLIGWNNGSATLSNITAIGNGAEGIYLDNQGGSGNVTISGANAAFWNGWEGLRIDTNGAVLVSNLEASLNGQSGVRIGAYGELKPVTLTNLTAFWNAINGLDLETHGVTTLNKIRSWFNSMDGMNVNTNGYKLTLMNSSFMCNSNDGFVYWGYPAPFTFVNINNIFLGNGNYDLREM